MGSRAANGFPKAKVAKEESGEKAPDVEGPKEQFKNRRFNSRADEEASKDTGGEDVEKPEEKVRSRRKRSGYDEEANKYCNEEDVRCGCGCGCGCGGGGGGRGGPAHGLSGREACGWVRH